jgi:hypothetical protein
MENVGEHSIMDAVVNSGHIATAFTHPQWSNIWFYDSRREWNLQYFYCVFNYLKDRIMIVLTRYKRKDEARALVVSAWEEIVTNRDAGVGVSCTFLTCAADCSTQPEWVDWGPETNNSEPGFAYNTSSLSSETFGGYQVLLAWGGHESITELFSQHDGVTVVIRPPEYGTWSGNYLGTSQELPQSTQLVRHATQEPTETNFWSSKIKWMREPIPPRTDESFRMEKLVSHTRRH